MTISVTVDTKAADKRIKKIQRTMSGKRIDKAVRVAENKTARFARRTINKEIRKSTALKQKSINSRVEVRTSKSAPPSLRFDGVPTSLKEFRSPKQKADGVAVTLAPGKRLTFKGTFIVDSIGRHVFKRVGPNRLPIRILTGPSVAKLAPPAIQEKSAEVSVKLGELTDEQIQKLWTKATS